MIREIRTALLMLLTLTVLTGIVYPLIVTGLGQALFPRQASGSVISTGGRAIGSSLIGQSFTDPRYFWGRPSATSPPYNAAASAGSNLGPTNPALLDSARARIARLQHADPGNSDPIPVDLVTSSASGLDPDISPAAAFYQAGRIARARGLDETQVRNLVIQSTEPRQFGLLGEARVNVLRLNLALDALSGAP